MYGASYGEEAYGSMSGEITGSAIAGRPIDCIDNTPTSGTPMQPADCDPDV